MKGVALAWRRALRAQFSRRMLGLSFLPLLITLLAWGGLLWAFLPGLLDWLHALFAEYGWFQSTSSMLSTLGLGMLKVIVVPMVAIVLLLPVMIGSSLLFMGIFAMPAIERYVGQRHFPKLEQRQGGSFAGSVWMNLKSVLVFALLWLCTVPLYAIPPLAVAVCRRRCGAGCRRA